MFLFAYLSIYFLLVVVLRTYLHWKKTGINAFTFDPSTDDAHGFNGKVYSSLILIEKVVVGIYAFKNSWYDFLLPFWYLEHPLLKKIAWVILIFSLPFIWLAQSQMTTSWRIGVDKKNSTNLVTQGLFSFSRNPIFLGVLLGNLGVFFIIPNAFTLVILSLSVVSINTQIRLEEAYLLDAFDKEYRSYRQKVRRWF